MNIVNSFLRNPFFWDLSQLVFGANQQKKALFKKVIKKKGRLLDFGCANGNLFPIFQEYEYYGVDIDNRLIEFAQKKYKEFKNAHFIYADILDRPFPYEFFDSILFSTAGHHIDDSLLSNIIEALSESLKVGGSIYFFDIIRAPREESMFLKFLLGFDRGRYMRDEARYRELIFKFSSKLIPKDIEVSRIKNTLMPQPMYFYVEFEKMK